MAYTKDQIARLSADRKGVGGFSYLDTEGNNYIGTSDGRIILKHTSDKAVSVEHEPGQTPETLRQYIDNLNLTTISIIQNNAKQVEINFGDTTPLQTITVHINDEYVKETSIIIPSVLTPPDRDADELEFTQFSCNVYNIVENTGYDVIVTDSVMQAEGVYLLNLIRI